MCTEQKRNKPFAHSDIYDTVVLTFPQKVED